MAKSANLGNVKAISECGHFLSDGVETEDGASLQKNLWDGFRLFQIAAELGNVEAQYRLGKCFEEGVGCDKDREQAFIWYELSAKSGNARAQCACGEILLEKADEDMNSEESRIHQKKARDWFRISAEQGDAEAMCEMGLLLEGEDDEQAFIWIKRSAAKGYGWALQELACFYWRGFGCVCSVNYELAEECYRKAAETGNALIMEMYAGFLRANNRGKEAFDWYKKAADCGRATALTDLGELYAEGYGVEENLGKAFQYYTQASNLGDGRGSYRLAECYEEGEVCLCDAFVARALYELALEQGYQPAQKKLDDFAHCTGS